MTTGNDNLDLALQFVPIVGTLMDAEDFIRNPSWLGAGNLALDVVSDFLGAKAIKGASEALRLRRLATINYKKAQEAFGMALNCKPEKINKFMKSGFRYMDTYDDLTRASCKTALKSAGLGAVAVGSDLGAQVWTKDGGVR